MSQKRKLPPLDDELEELKAEFNQLLSFYSLQLQSHGALIVGFALTIFTLIQAWDGLAPTSRSVLYVSISFSLLMGIVGTVLVYVSIRFLVYGLLAKAMTGGDSNQYDEARRSWVEEHEDGENKWITNLPLTKASEYASYFFRRYAAGGIPAISVFYTKKRQVTWTVLLLSFLWISSLSSALFFGSPDFVVSILTAVAIVVSVPSSTYLWKERHTRRN